MKQQWFSKSQVISVFIQFALLSIYLTSSFHVYLIPLHVIFDSFRAINIIKIPAMFESPLNPNNLRSTTFCVLMFMQ